MIFLLLLHLLSDWCQPYTIQVVLITDIKDFSEGISDAEGSMD